MWQPVTGTKPGCTARDAGYDCDDTTACARTVNSKRDGKRLLRVAHRITGAATATIAK